MRKKKNKEVVLNKGVASKENENGIPFGEWIKRNWIVCLISFVLSVISLIISFNINNIGDLRQHYGELKVSCENNDKAIENFKTQLEKKSDKVDEDIKSFNEDIKELGQDVSKLTNSVDNIHEEFELFSSMIEKIVTKTSSNVIVYNTSLNASSVEISQPDWGERNEDEEFIAITRCFANTRMVYSYQNGGDQVFFAGQYDENEQWDGSCLINVYSEGKLKISTETEYKSGLETKAKQVFKTTNGIWMYAERIYYQGVDRGDSWEFPYVGEFNQKVDFEEPIEELLYKPEELRKTMGDYTQWYHGKISDGLYSDSSGDSYMISKYEDGTIKTIYMGGFKNGTFCDESFASWYVSRIRERNTKYNYYVGPFSNGGPALSGNDNRVYFDDAISEEELEYIVKGTPFETETGWLEELFDDKTELPDLK